MTASNFLEKTLKMRSFLPLWDGLCFGRNLDKQGIYSFSRAFLIQWCNFNVFSYFCPFLVFVRGKEHPSKEYWDDFILWTLININRYFNSKEESKTSVPVFSFFSDVTIFSSFFSFSFNTNIMFSQFEKNIKALTKKKAIVSGSRASNNYV